MTDIDKFLQNCTNKKILIKLKDSKTIHGNLQSFDEQMNLTLTNAQDITDKENKIDLNKIILRGSMILMVAPLED